MNAERKKAEIFFESFVNKGVYNSLSWIGAGMCTCLFVMMCFVPAQDMIIEYTNGDEVSVLLLMLLVILGAVAGWLRIQPYALYNENQKNRKVSELLQYHPIDQKEIKKLRIIYLVRFMGKVAFVSMIAQIPVTLGEYGSLSWINFIYIFFIAFVWPVAYNAVGIAFEK